MLRSRVAHSVVSVPRHSRGTNAQWKRTLSEAAEQRDGIAEDRMLAKTALHGDESAIIRAPSFPGSMRDVLAIIRTVERNYGLIKEFKCYRDCEVSSKYQSIIRVTFRHQQSTRRLTGRVEDLPVTLPPPISHHLQGGIGLADLEEYLETTKSPSISSSDDGSNFDSTTSEMEEVLEDNERIMPCTIQRSGTPFHTPSHCIYFWPSRGEREPIWRQFINWGGFHDFPPLEKGHPLPVVDFFGGSKIEHFRMRYCLRKASEQLQVPNPYECSTEHSSGSVSTTEVSPLDWEPLSGPTPAEAEFDPLAVILEDVQKEEQARSDAKISPEADIAGFVEATSIPQATVPSTPSRSKGNATKPLRSKAPSSATSPAHTDEELTMQLHEARLLAEQVTQELVKKPERTPTLEKASRMQTEDPLLELPAHSLQSDPKMNLSDGDTAESTKVSESNSVEPRTARPEQKGESESKKNGGIFGQLFGRLF